ncbi:hypothetical protein [Clostridium ljungdahlii]|uniref:Uncharacterized protein n=1 Tax=Clostridium ljungdahlii (strain ATCC 55383 / DSM 13528 / PETC) TaxID=748727 RepID=D8GTA1_CLOLD|nr:hypothetical protein [Clostridium ljungdahlii]ADK16700.1 hypothetical protein CLJU_c36590 [Clostridium ljungdahlii DSM 13528]OAA89426.1 hypothetical protein WX45_01258 [Clostridium ljungdahlii DSM 13528]
MEENLNIIQQIMLKAIKITTTQEQKVAFEFLPGIKVLSISIITGQCNHNELRRSWSVDVAKTELLKVVLKELKNLDATTEDTDKQIDDFLG